MAIKILSVQSSASMQWSLTRKLSKEFLKIATEASDNVEIKSTDLVKDHPPLMESSWISGAFNKNALSQAETEALKKSNEYIEQVSWANIILIGTPMYNYGMPAALKAWFDQVARINKTFSFDLERGDFPIEPILNNKKLVVLTSSGEFGFGKGEIREDFNHLLPHIQSCAHYLGVDAKKDMHHIGIEYQEFKDDRHEASKRAAFAKLPQLVNHLLSE